MVYYSAFERKENVTNATTWINLKDLMLNEISQSRRSIYVSYLEL